MGKPWEFVADGAGCRAFDPVHDISRTECRRGRQEKVYVIPVAFHGDNTEACPFAALPCEFLEAVLNTRDIEDLAAF